jgi:hypothetical protein
MGKKLITVREVKSRIGAILSLPGDARLARHLALKTNFGIDEVRAMLAAHAEDVQKASPQNEVRIAPPMATHPKGMSAEQRGKLDAEAAVSLGFAS